MEKEKSTKKKKFVKPPLLTVKVRKTNIDNFSFVIDGKLAGMGLPKDTMQEICVKFLKERKIGGIVTLTHDKDELNVDLLKKEGIDHQHEPVIDFGIPTMDAMKKFVKYVDDMNSKGKGVVVHCFAGVGRTGTYLVGYCILKGMGSYKECLDFVRKKRNGRAVETRKQKMFLQECVVEFEKMKKSEKKDLEKK